MPDILGRFENITFGLFDRQGIKVVGFWTKKDVNELVYVCEYADEDEMNAKWEAFRADPEWIAAREKTEANGPIVTEVISEILEPTSFSPLR